MSEARTPRPAGPVAAGAFAFDRNARRVAGVPLYAGGRVRLARALAGGTIGPGDRVGRRARPGPGYDPGARGHPGVVARSDVDAVRPGDRGEVLGRATRSTAPTSPAVVAAVPTGFTDSAVWSGLTLPTAIAFGPGGKVFVGEKGGIVKVFDSPSDPTPTQVVDLRARVQDFWDRACWVWRSTQGSAPPATTSSTCSTPTTSTRRAARPPGATAAPPHRGRPPTAVPSPAICPGSRSTPPRGRPAGRSSR